MEDKKPEIEESNKDLEQKVDEALKTCYDPEIPVDVYELGLIYEIKISEDKDVHVLMTLTSPACPVAETLPPEIEQTIAGVDSVKSAKVEITFDPPWEKEMMSDEAKLELGMW